MTRREALALAAITTIAFALRLAWVAYADFAPTLNDDAGRYDFIGRSLADGGGFVNPNGTTTMFWPPGYPFVLAALYKMWPADLLGAHELSAALVLNAAFGAATVALTCMLGRRAFGTVAALAGAALLALFPSMIMLAGVTLTETAFTFFAMLALLLVVESRWRHSRALLIGAGLTIGCAALVRGQGALLPLVAAPFWMLTSPGPRSADEVERSRRSGLGLAARDAAVRVALTLALTAVVAAPWAARNYIESGSLVPISSNDGVNFYIGHSPGADGRGRKVDELVFRYPDLEQAEAEARISRDGYREGVEYALDHPAREVELAARKLFFLYWRDDEGLRWNDGHGERAVFSRSEHRAWVWISNAYYYAVLALAGAGLLAPSRTTLAPASRAPGTLSSDAGTELRLRRDVGSGASPTSTGRASVLSPPTSDAVLGADGSKDPSPPARLAPATAVLLLAFIAYWTLVHIAFFADPRFHAPVMPAFALFAGNSAAWLLALPRRAPRPA